MKKFFGEFKEFIMRGNVMDLAVAVIIGGAFTAIVNALCDNLISPLLGIFGGATHVHPGAAAALRLMGVQSAQELASVAAAVGLAQNLAALKALSTEGIQRGHMSLHARQMAVAAGASGNAVDRIAEQMIRENHISASYAAELAAKGKNKE